MRLRPVPWALGSLLSLAACEGSSPDPLELSCPAGTALYRAAAAPQLGGERTFEEWCKTPAGVADGPYRVVDETGNGTQGERGAVVPGPVVLVTGQFEDGLAQGTWRRSMKRYYAANFTVDLLVAESWDRGLADGTWTDYDANLGLDEEGVPLVVGHRSYRGGVACGSWTSNEASGGGTRQTFIACDEVGLLASDDFPLPPAGTALGAPVTTDFGWDGARCPDGSAAVPEAGDVRAFSCWRDGVRDGPFGRWYGAPGSPLIDKRDDGQYRAGKRTGTWRGWHSNRILALQGDYGDDGERAASWRFYFADGWLSERADFVAGLRDGAVETYHDGGAKASEERWYRGLRDGDYSSWRVDGAEVYVGHYTRGLMNGDWVVWSDEWGPRAKTIQRWSMGIPIGTWEATYDVSGHRAWSVSFIDGYAEGISTQWWDSGGEREVGPYARGLRWGVWRTYFEDGTLESERNYIADHLSGPARTFHPDGSPASEGAYEDDERAYAWTFWDAAGTATTCTYPQPGAPACP